MAPPKNLEARAARDRVIDLLGLGQTYPLQNPEVQSLQLTVDVNQPAAIKIRPGQEGVRYELYEGEAPVDQGGCHVDGEGGEALLPGPPITNDRTFRIFARKIAWPERSAFLLQAATVKVDLDPALDASIKGLPRLHPELVNPLAVDPWVADHGSVVEVVVSESQPSASYRLVYAGPAGADVETEWVPSKGGPLSLFTSRLEEDTSVRIRATKTFGPGNTKEIGLHVELPLAVRAAPSLAVAGLALVDPSAAAAVVIAGSQQSVSYGAHARALRDRDFFGGASPAEPALVVPVPASLDVPAHEVWVRAPERLDPWQDQPGYEPLGAPKPGTGADLALELGPISEDRAIVFKASKEHFSDGLAGGLRVLPGRTELQLERPFVALARPAPAPPLALELSPNAGGAGASMSVSGGQHGVFYHFRIDPQGPKLGLPAYFHRLDEDDPQQNRGVGQLEIEKDFALARDTTQGPAADDADPAFVPPLDPVVEVAPVPPGKVSVMAVKARTGVGWAASETFDVATKPGP